MSTVEYDVAAPGELVTRPAWMERSACASVGLVGWAAVRLVVARVEGKDVLECGHVVPAPFDDDGDDTHPYEHLSVCAYRRNCKPCGDTIEHDLWFPSKGGSTRRLVKDAYDICAGCPVKEQCLDYAIDHGIRTGVWGGMSPRLRKELTSI